MFQFWGTGTDEAKALVDAVVVRSTANFNWTFIFIYRYRLNAAPRHCEPARTLVWQSARRRHVGLRRQSVCEERNGLPHQ